MRPQPRVPLVPPPRGDLVSRFVASSHPSTAADYSRCGRCDGGICLPGLLQNAAVAAAANPADRGISRQLQVYLQAYVTNKGVIMQPVIVSAVTLSVFVAGIADILDEDIPNVSFMRVGTLLRAAVQLKGWELMNAKVRKRLARWVVNRPINESLQVSVGASELRDERARSRPFVQRKLRAQSDRLKTIDLLFTPHPLCSLM